MNVLHVSYSFPPDPPGGTEVYIDDLCRALAPMGIRSVVAAPASADAAYEVGGLTVRRFASQPAVTDLATLYGTGDDIAADAFDRVLEKVQPDVLHQHAMSPACSVQIMRRAKQRRIPVVFTWHTPAVSCQRATMLRWGVDVCNGDLSTTPCAACTLHGLGMARSMATLAAALPEAVGDAIGAAGRAGGIWTAARMSALTRTRRDSVRALFSLVDRFVAPAPWVSQLLRTNGVPEERIAVIGHGVRGTATPRLRVKAPTEPLRMVHLGRLDPAKGTRLLLQAFRDLPALHATLDVIGLVQNEAAVTLRTDLQTLTAGDRRVQWLDPLPPAEVIERLADYDVVVVPSQVVETGPLVALEAFAAGVPVLASALGGLQDKITHGVNGLLVAPFHSMDAWRDALRQCAAGDLVRRLRSGVRPPPSVADLATAMRNVYLAATGASNARSLTPLAVAT